MASCREHYDALLVDVRCNLVGEISLRSITKHHRTPCSKKGFEHNFHACLMQGSQNYQEN